MLYGITGRSLWDEMDRFLGSARTKEQLSQYLYRVDVEETENAVLVTMEIPGIEKKEDLHIEIDGDVLTIHGEVKRTRSSENSYFHQSERYFGTFKRVVRLPAEVKADGAHARYQNGVLELEFLKDSRPAARTIEVDFH